MSNYSDNPAMVRVDFFKRSRWYTTEAVKWLDYHASPIDGLIISLTAHLNGRLGGMLAVCLEPYSELSYPVTWLIPHKERTDDEKPTR